MAYRIRAGISKVVRAIVVMAERVAHKPLSRATKKKLAMSATRRDTFVWNITRGGKVTEKVELDSLFVHVMDDLQLETPAAEEFPEAPIAEKVYNTPSYTTVTPTSDAAVMYEFSGSFNFDKLGLDDSEPFEEEYQAEVVEAPVKWEYVETEEEKAFFEDLYDDLTVDAVLECMDTIDLYPKVQIAGYLSAPVSQISGYLSAPVSEVVGFLAPPVSAEAAVEETVAYEYEETEEEKAFFEKLYEDLEADAVVAYMDSADLFAPVRRTEKAEEAYSDEVSEAVCSYMEMANEIEIESELESITESAIEETVEDIYDVPAAESFVAFADMEERSIREYEAEEEYFEGLYEDLTVDAVLEYMDSVELEARPAPEYVITEIASPEVGETTIDIEPEFVPDYLISDIETPEVGETSIEIEAPVVEAPVVEQPRSILAQFVFGFDAPVNAKASETKFRFINGTEEEDADDEDSVQIMTYNGDAAVSAQSVSNGPLAL